MISLVTTYKNRRHHIERSFPSWLSSSIRPENFEIILVDYDSDDDVSSFLITLNSPFHIIRLKCSNLLTFALSHARNIGVNYASGEWILFNDIDTSFFPNTVSGINRLLSVDHYLSAVDSRIKKNIINGGFMVVSKVYHNLVCGFNENMRGWGYEDIDYRKRLESAGLKWRQIPSSWYFCIDHSDEERVQCYDVRKDLSWNKNRQISLTPWYSLSPGRWDDIEIEHYGKHNNI